MKELRKIIRETLEEQMKNDRYVANMEFYVYANSDEEAKIKSQSMAKEMEMKLDNQAKITKIIKQSFGTLGNNPLDL